MGNCVLSEEQIPPHQASEDVLTIHTWSGPLSCRCQQVTALEGGPQTPCTHLPFPSACMLSGFLLPETPLLYQFLFRSKVGARF